MKRGLLVVLLSATSSAALAQTVGGGGSIALPEIIVNASTPFDPYKGKYNGVIGETSDITGVNKPILDIPRSVYVVTPKTLQEQMPQSLAEAVQTVPGAYTGNQGGGNSDLITIKGFQTGTTDSFLIGNDNGLLIDGIRAPFDRAFNANTQSVELLSGPASYLYGYSDEGGVLNLQRKLPLPEAHYAVDLLGGAVTGSFKDVAGSFDLTGPIYKSTEGVLAYRLVGSAARDEPWRIGDTVNRDFLMAPTFAWYSDLFTATIAYEHGQNQQPYDRGDTSLDNAPLNISRTESYSEPYSVYNEKYDWVHGKVDYNLNKNNEIRLTYSYASTGLNFNEIRSDNQSDFDPVTGDISRYYYTNGPDGERTNQGYVQLSGVHRFDTGPIHHEFNEGVDYYDATQTEAAEYETAPFTNFNLYNPVYGQPPVGPLSLIGTQTDGLTLNAKIRELGVFAEESATLGRLTLSGGGRYTDLYTFQNYYGNINADNTVHLFLPSASALFKITDTVSLFADYSQSIHPNIAAVGQPNLNIVGPVKAETGVGYEGGIKAKFLDGNLLAQVSVFDITKNNVATQTENNLESFTQVQQSQGIALSVLGRVTPNIDVNVSYSHQNVIVLADNPINMDVGNQVVNAPANTYGVLASYHFLDGPLNRLTLNAGVFGATANAVDVENTFFLPGYAIANIGFSYTFARAANLPITTLSFKINNLLDSTYYPASGTKENWITVGEPRNFLLDLNMQL